MLNLKLQRPQDGKEEFAILLADASNITCNEDLYSEVSKYEQVAIRKFIGSSWELGPEEKISSKEFCLTWQGD